MLVRETHKSAVNTWIGQQLPQLKVGPLQAALLRPDPQGREALAKAIARLRELFTPATPSR